MKLLMIHACEASVAGWSRGDFLDCKTVVLWTKASVCVRVCVCVCYCVCRRTPGHLCTSCLHGASLACKRMMLEKTRTVSQVDS